jgi:hypothetical protein
LPTRHRKKAFRRFNRRGITGLVVFTEESHPIQAPLLPWLFVVFQAQTPTFFGSTLRRARCLAYFYQIFDPQKRGFKIIFKDRKKHTQDHHNPALPCNVSQPRP